MNASWVKVLLGAHVQQSELFLAILEMSVLLVQLPALDKTIAPNHIQVNIVMKHEPDTMLQRYRFKGIALLQICL